MPVSLGLVRYADFPSLRTTMQQVFARIRCVPHKDMSIGVCSHHITEYSQRHCCLVLYCCSRLISCLCPCASAVHTEHIASRLLRCSLYPMTTRQSAAGARAIDIVVLRHILYNGSGVDRFANICAAGETTSRHGFSPHLI